MPDQRGQVFSLGRFLVRVVPLAVAAGVLWKLTVDPNAAFTVHLVKGLHRLAGRPAPYLYCDEQRLFWHATMFPPVVALTLGSYWLRWWDRLLRTAVGYVAHCGVTAIAITIHESPYLQPTAMLNAITSTLVNANYLMFGVVIWVLAAGPWYAAAGRGASGGHGGAPWWRRVASAVRRGWLTRVVVLWCALAMVVPVYGRFGSDAGMAARADVAAAMRQVAFFPHPSWAEVNVSAAEQRARDKATRQALLAIEKAIRADVAEGLGGGALFYLTSKLFLSLRPPDPADVKMFQNRALLAYRAAMKYRSR